MKPIVLLIDDDENVLNGLSRALRKEPYQLLTASSGDEAMMILKDHDVDVIVVDEIMPGISGGDVLAWSAENAPDTIRIMLTGNATTAIAILRYKRRPGVQFLHKALQRPAVGRCNSQGYRAPGAFDRKSPPVGCEPAAVLRVAAVLQKTRPVGQGGR